MVYIFLVLVLCILSLVQRDHAQQICKPIPGSIDWPDAAQWSTLNDSVSGNLVAATPLAAVCHEDWPTYNDSACRSVTSQWTNTSFHAADPFTVDYNDIACLPASDAPCSASVYPVYAVKAQSVEDVQAGVDFARRTGVRLVIKNTGHDYLGRSSGPASLSIWTHELKGMQLYPDDAAAIELGGVASVKVYAGEQMRDVYAFAAQNNVTIVGGADMDVGVGGWVSGGGHSPISSRYGLGADQVLAMEVVTADGAFRCIDKDRDFDLFWALRGGGAGTFGVLISVTFKVYEQVSTSIYYFSYATTPNSDTYWAMVTYFHSDLPRLSELGLMGYYFLQPDTGGPNRSTAGNIYGVLHGPMLSVNQTTAILRPLEDKLLGQDLGADAIQLSGSVSHRDDFGTWWSQTNPPLIGGFSLRLTSRLWGQEALTNDTNKLEAVLRLTTPPPLQFFCNFVGGPGTRSPVGGIAGDDNAVLPAWRKTYTHVIAARTWPDLDAQAKSDTTADLRDNLGPALASVAPDMGSYMNEADPTEPEWKRAFFGENYDRLASVKAKWDPQGVFWCKNCVGSDYWDPVGSDGIENGVGQSAVQLCRAATVANGTAASNQH